MKARWRVLVAASVAVMAAGSPALAQETTAPAQNELIGNPQLRDFSLEGTVTRPAPAPVQVEPRPRETGGATNDEPSPGATRPSPPQRQSAPAAERAESPARQVPPQSGPPEPDLPAPTPVPTATPTVTLDEAPTLESEPAFVPAPADPGVEPSGSGLPMLPWLIAALALAAAAGWYFLRQRPGESFAGAGSLQSFDTAPPDPAPPPARAPPAAAPPRQAGDGVVSTRLRPWLEIEFTPSRAVVDDEKAAVAFELSVFNSGSLPARDVLLEASLFNAGAMQDQQIRLFFENPVAKGDRIPVVPPLQRVAVSTAVFLPRDQVRPLEVEGRQLFVPMIAFNALYRWGGSEGQSSASYLVGKTTKGEKLAPLRVDLGPRVFRNLAAREHELRLRK